MRLLDIDLKLEVMNLLFQRLYGFPSYVINNIGMGSDELEKVWLFWLRMTLFSILVILIRCVF